MKVHRTDEIRRPHFIFNSFAYKQRLQRNKTHPNSRGKSVCSNCPRHVRGRFFPQAPATSRSLFWLTGLFLPVTRWAATFLRDASSLDASLLRSRREEWEIEVRDKIARFCDITVCMSSVNLAANVLSFVPVAGAFFAIGSVVATVATTFETNDPINEMNEVLQRGSSLSQVFVGVPGMPEYLRFAKTLPRGTALRYAWTWPLGVYCACGKE